MQKTDAIIQKNAYFEKKVFESVLLISLVASAYGMLDNFWIPRPMLVYVLEAVIFAIVLTIYLLFKFGNHFQMLITPFLMIIFADFTAMWFLVGGFRGVMPFFFFIFLIVSIIISPKYHRRWLISGMMTVFIALMLMQWLNPSLIAPPVEQTYSVAMPFSQIISFTATAYLIWVLKGSYDKRSQAMLNTNQLLLHKNKEALEVNELLKGKQEEITVQNEILIAQREELNVQKELLEETVVELKETQSQLVHSEKMASLGVLTAGIAHEINNPINYISAGVNGLKQILPNLLGAYRNREFADETAGPVLASKKALVAQVLEDIQEGTDRATRIVRELRDFSLSDKSALTPSDLHAGLESTLSLLKNLYKDRIAIQRNYGNLPLVECYPGKINQVFLNLLNNAIHAIEGEGQITISTGVMPATKSSGIAERQAFVRIADNGKGMPETELKKIFEPFYTTKPSGQGTGLGLSISLKIAQEMHGDIMVTSQEGEGSAFTLVLPV